MKCISWVAEEENDWNEMRFSFPLYTFFINKYFNWKINGIYFLVTLSAMYAMACANWSAITYIIIIDKMLRFLGKFIHFFLESFFSHLMHSILCEFRATGNSMLWSYCGTFIVNVIDSLNRIVKYTEQKKKKESEAECHAMQTKKKWKISEHEHRSE